MGNDPTKELALSMKSYRLGYQQKRWTILLVLLLPGLIEGGNVPQASLKSENIRREALDRIELLPSAYFKREYESVLVSRLREFWRTRCIGRSLCRLLIIPTDNNWATGASPPTAQLLAIKGDAEIRIQFWIGRRTILLTKHSPHDWKIENHKFEFYQFGLGGPRDDNFSFEFRTATVASDHEGKKLLLSLEQLTGAPVLDLKIRRRSDAGESGPSVLWVLFVTEIGDLLCGHSTIGGDRYQCTIAAHRGYPH